MFCTRCGTENPDTSRFCGKCGEALAQPANSLQPNFQPASGAPFYPRSVSVKKITAPVVIAVSFVLVLAMLAVGFFVIRPGVIKSRLKHTWWMDGDMFIDFGNNTFTDSGESVPIKWKIKDGDHILIETVTGDIDFDQWSWECTFLMGDNNRKLTLTDVDDPSEYYVCVRVDY